MIKSKKVIEKIEKCIGKIRSYSQSNYNQSSKRKLTWKKKKKYLCYLYFHINF